MLQLVDPVVPSSRDEVEHELLRIRGEIEIRELYFSRLAAALQSDETSAGRRESSRGRSGGR